MRFDLNFTSKESGDFFDAQDTLTMRWISEDEIRQVGDFRHLLRIWDSPSASNKIMSRQDFTPRDLKGALGFIAILDLKVVNQKVIDAIVRLVGTQLTPVYGELTGKSINEMEAVVSKRVWDSVKKVFKTGKPVGRYSQVLSQKRPSLSMVSLFCPMASDRANIDGILLQVSMRTADNAGFAAHCD